MSPHCAPSLADTGPCFEKYNNTLRALGPREIDRTPFAFENWIKSTMGNRCRLDRMELIELRISCWRAHMDIYICFAGTKLRSTASPQR